MIVDTSAVVAILNGEAGWEGLDFLLRDSTETLMSAATYVELGIVVDRMAEPSVSRRLDRLLDVWGVEIVSLTAEHARLAREAHRDFGRGTGHPARLNLGDCYAYALATALQQPLLFTGNDFIHTDVEPALTT